MMFEGRSTARLSSVSETWREAVHAKTKMTGKLTLNPQ
jgi:hypothetical protein